jgi:UDP-N-acetylmuramoyl-tripeptide--D-alanyl-D-alanine ligase
MITANFIRNTNMGSLINFDSSITDVIIDSRKATAGSMFVALPGENVDGHEFVKSALAKGAALCVVSKKWAQQAAVSGLPLWIVESPEKALQQLAANWRDQFNIPILAITGTNGKTTTRAMCELLLRKNYILHCTTGNLNNHLGLPLTLLKLTQKHTFSLLELGTNHFGEIAFLSDLCKPSTGLITNIGFGHTEFFRDLRGIAREKEALFQALPNNGLSFINLNDPLIVKMNHHTKLVRYGINTPGADFQGQITGFDENANATLKINNEIKIRLKVPGNSMVQNALAAVAVGRTFGISWTDIKEVLESFEAVQQRFTIKQSKIGQIINDSYNANPNSTKAAIETFSKMKLPGRRVFVFGDMFELGDLAESCHREIGKSIVEASIDIFFAYGPLSLFAVEEARRAGLKQVKHFLNKKDLISALKNTLKVTDTILFKGSRGNQLEKVIEGIQV